MVILQYNFDRIGLFELPVRSAYDSAVLSNLTWLVRMRCHAAASGTARIRVRLQFIPHDVATCQGNVFLTRRRGRRCELGRETMPLKNAYRPGAL